MSYILSQAVKDSIADAETLRMALGYALVDWCSTKINLPGWYSPEVLAWMAETDAQEAFRVCPGLREAK